MTQSTFKKNLLRTLAGSTVFFAVLLAFTAVFAAILAGVERFERFYPAVSYAVFLPAGAAAGCFVRRESGKAPVDAAILSLIAIALTWLLALAVSGGHFRLGALAVKSAVTAISIFLTAWLVTRRKSRRARKDPFKS